MSENQVRAPIMLDSGAFSAWRQGGKIDLKEYIKYVQHVVGRFPEADFEYVNLDVIGDGKASFRNWMTMRKQGLKPLPVFHVGTDEKWLKMYLDCTDRVGLGMLARMTRQRRMLALDRIWGTYLVDGDGMPTARVHGMGIADFILLKRYPWWTVDSTSWLLAAGMGDIYVPGKIRGGWAFDRSPKRVTVTGPIFKWNHGERLNLAVSHHDQQVLRSYFDHIEEPVDGETGVRNSWETRRHANIRFFWEYVRRLTWPRRFIGKRMSAIWELNEDAVSVREALLPIDPGHTIMFLSGSNYWKTGEQFLEIHARFNWLGRLTTYWDLDTPMSKARLLEDVLEIVERERKRA